MTYAIDTDVPLPVAPTRQVYPFDDLAIGQSFAAPRAKMFSVQAIASRKSKGDKQFETRLLGDKIRVWRTK